jgi:hypothetical protein
MNFYDYKLDGKRTRYLPFNLELIITEQKSSKQEWVQNFLFMGICLDKRITSWTPIGKFLHLSVTRDEWVKRRKAITSSQGSADARTEKSPRRKNCKCCGQKLLNQHSAVVPEIEFDCLKAVSFIQSTMMQTTGYLIL